MAEGLTYGWFFALTKRPCFGSKFNDKIDDFQPKIREKIWVAEDEEL